MTLGMTFHMVCVCVQDRTGHGFETRQVGLGLVWEEDRLGQEDGTGWCVTTLLLPTFLFFPC